MGQIRMLPFLAHVAIHPASWGPLMRLGRNSGQAARRLGETVNRFLLDKDWAARESYGLAGRVIEE